jgi:RDD family
MRSTCSRDVLPGKVMKRCIAWALDVLAVMVLITSTATLIVTALGPTVRVSSPAGSAEVDTLMLAVNALVATAINASYFVISWRVLRASPAQRLFHLRVYSFAGEDALSWGKAVIRWLLLFPPFGVLVALSASMPILGALIWSSAPIWYLVLLVTTLRDAGGQGLHDHLSGSVVRTSRNPLASADVY